MTYPAASTMAQPTRPDRTPPSIMARDMIPRQVALRLETTVLPGHRQKEDVKWHS